MVFARFNEIPSRLFIMFSLCTVYLCIVYMYCLFVYLFGLGLIRSVPGARTGAVVGIVDYGPRGPWFETWPGRRSLWP